MAANIQILLPLLCVVLAEGHILDPSRPHYGHPHLSKRPHDVFDPYGSTIALKQPADDRPINGDIFSYNNQHAFNHFYHDGNFNPLLGMNPYFGYPGPYDNFNHMPVLPFGIPNIQNEFNMPGQGLPNYMNGMGGDNNPAEQPDSREDSTEMNNGNPNEQYGENQQPEAKKHEPAKPSDVDHKLEDMPPKTNKVKKDDTDNGSKKDNVNLNPKKDFLLVDNNGNSVYLLHENPPSTNAVVEPNNNQPAGNNVVYVPYNPQQPTNQVYQVVNGQPPVSTNVPVIASRQDFNGYNNVMATPVQNNPPLNNNNPPLNNNNPSYVLIYANGQLIQVPGVVINSQPNNVQQNGNPVSNIMVPNTVPMSNVMYANPSNQGNNPMYVQMPNVAPVSNNAPNNGLVIQNPQPVANPNAIPDNTMGAYGSTYQPNSVPQPSGAQPNNMGNGYAQPNMVPNGNQGSIGNSNSAEPLNNQAVPAYALPVDNNQNMYSQPPNQEKDANGVASAPNNVPATNSQPQPAAQPTDLSNNNVDISDTLGAQPAIMVSGFKETDGSDDKDKKKEEKDKKDKDKKEKDKKKDKKKK